MQEKSGSEEGDKKHENLASETSKSASDFLSALDFPDRVRHLCRKRTQTTPRLSGAHRHRRESAWPTPDGAAGASRDENVEPLNFDDYGDFKADLC